MINVNQITSQLAKMPDQSLQKFAAMHKNDPYTVSLALAESNRRKELRSSAQARMAGQQQPKVVDQEVAQMASVDPMGNVTGALPEEVGIGKLPAQNLRKLAGGGIVAFEEGGEVPRFQDRGLVQLPTRVRGPNGTTYVRQPHMSDDEWSNFIDKYALTSLTNYAPYGHGNTATTPRYTPEQLTEAQRLREMGLFDLLKEKFGPAWQALTTPPAAKTKQEVYQSGLDVGGPGSSPANMGAPAVGQTINFQNPSPAGATDGAPPAAPAAQPAPGLPSINAYMKQFEMALPKKEEAQSEESFMAKREEPMKAFFEKAGKQIETERDRLKSDKEQDFYMSLIQGGLAAAAEAGPNALQNIAKGFSTGAASYKDALKDFRKASQENAKMEMDLMKAQAADKKGDIDAYQKHTEAVAERNSKIDQYKASGVASLLGHDMTSRATITAAGMPSGTERLISRIGTDPKFAAAYEKYAAMGPNAKLPNQILAKYADPKELMKLRVMDPDLYEQVKAQLDMAAGLGGGVPRPVNQPTGVARP